MRSKVKRFTNKVSVNDRLSSIKCSPFGANVTVEWFREGPLSSALLRGQSGSREGASLRLWSGVALLCAGLLLFVYAPTLAESIVFHYASGVSLAVRDALARVAPQR